jgi:hypothetical protein
MISRGDILAAVESLIEEASDLRSELQTNPATFNMDRIECPPIMLAASFGRQMTSDPDANRKSSYRVGFLNRLRRLLFEMNSRAADSLSRIEKLHAPTEDHFFFADPSGGRAPTDEAVRRGLDVLAQAKTELLMVRASWSSFSS